jgi:hypothetical protein
MVDGINLDVPAIHARFPTHPVACYVNGEYAWTQAQEALFARKVRISVESNPFAAQHARVIDCERGAAGFRDAAPFCAQRARLGHRDGTVYSSLANVPLVLEGFPGSTGPPRWWLAWYWARPSYPSAAQVLAELKRLTGVTVEPAQLWGCQYRSDSQWDLSVVYGPQDWSR